MAQGAVKLYILRHGLPRFEDSEKRYIGRIDLPLSNEGLTQAEQASSRLADKGIGAVYTSPLSRCRKFAEIIAEKLGLGPVIELPGLQEIDMGSWEYRPIREISKAYPEEYKLRGLNMAGFAPKGGETFLQCQVRAVEAITVIAAAGRDALIVTHTGLIRSFLCHVESRDLNDLFYYKIPYGGILTVSYEDGRFSFCTPPPSCGPVPESFPRQC